MGWRSAAERLSESSSKELGQDQRLKAAAQLDHDRERGPGQTPLYLRSQRLKVMHSLLPGKNPPHILNKHEEMHRVLGQRVR